jgi:hypothetical protein
MPLGWRTRGQATLKPGPVNPDDKNFHIVLAKGGIYTRGEYEREQDKNELIVGMFFKRKPTDQIYMEVMTGIRDMVDYDSDLVNKKVTKRLNMEYDWKRVPYAIGKSYAYNHVVFSTSPWRSVEQFQKIREIWQQFQKKNLTCIKTVEDYRSFSTYAETVGNVSEMDKPYLKKKDGDIFRLRVVLCSAWRQSKCGFKWNPDKLNADKFAQILSKIGIPCDRANVEYGLLRKFKPKSCSPTGRCVKALSDLKKVFPSLQPEQLLSGSKLGFSLAVLPASECPFVSRAS